MEGQNFELGVTRFIAASPAKVWEVMAERQAEWWCPAPWRAEVVEQDRRAGGACHMKMHGPAGEMSPNNGIYLAYEEGRRFVVTDAVTADFHPAGPFMVGLWQIEPEGSGTRYTACARHWTQEAMTQHAEMGFTDGWEAAAAQLAEICEREAIPA